MLPNRNEAYLLKFISGADKGNNLFEIINNLGIKPHSREYNPVYKIIEELYPRPGWWAVVQRHVVPPKGGGIIHYARAGVDALRHKVGAVATYPTKITEDGVLPEGVFSGVGHRTVSQIRFSY